MSSHLTTVAFHARKFFKYSGLALGFLIVLTVIVIPIAVNIYQTLNPPEPLPLSVNRSKLPLIIFPEIEKYNYQFNFQLPNNSLPSFPNRAFVFYITAQRKLGFATKTEVETTSRAFGYEDVGQSVGEYQYQWVRMAPAPLTLKINAANNYQVSLFYEWQNDNALKASKLTIDKNRLVSQAVRVLEKAGVSMEDLNFTSPQYIYFADIGNTLGETQSLSEADFVRLDFFKNEIEYNYNDLYFYADQDYQSRFNDINYNYKIVSDKARQANTYAIISGATARALDGVIEANIYQSKIEYLSPLPYYLKDVKNAKIELENGNAYVASSPKQVENNSVTIRRVYLAYYDAGQYQEYLQPVYIFAENEIFETNGATLKPGFVAYVPAIRVDQLVGN